MDEPSTSGTKRKRVVLTIGKKLEILAELKKGATPTNLAQKFDVARTTINDIKSNAAELEKFLTRMESGDSFVKNRKTVKSATNVALDEAVFLWFLQKRNEGIPISGPILCEKALMFNEKLNGDAGFKASEGWLYKFKQRHGIRQLNIEGEKLSAASAEIVSDFKKKFDELMRENGYTRDQVYNADETGLNYKALPTKTLASFCENFAPGYKMQKQRVTLMMCANANGTHRLPLLVLGSAKRPHCYKGISMDALPVTYRNQKKAWMTQSIFTEWFHVIFVPSVQDDLKKKNLPQKAILLLDNAGAHPNDSLMSKDGNITVFFLPPNTTSLLQPMDQGVIETFKRLYRKKFLRELLSDDGISLKEYWKKYNMKNVVDNSADAWDDLAEETLKKSWNKLWPDPDQLTVNNETVSLSQEIVDIASHALHVETSEINEWLSCDSEDIGQQLLSDDEIVELVHEESDDEYAEMDDGGNEDCDVRVSASDLRKEVEKAAANM